MESLLTAIAGKRWFRVLLPVLICIAVVAAYWQPLHLDLWNDEVYSLIHFQQVPLLTTITDYHETNNHIFFNLVMNIYLRIIGSPTTLTVFEHPEIVRIVPLAFTLVTYVVMYRWISRMSGVWAGLLACALLTATLPYYNFALQYRAYSMVIMLATAYLYLLWLYLRNARMRYLWSLTACAAAIFYAHPGGLYLTLGFTNTLRLP